MFQWPLLQLLMWQKSTAEFYKHAIHAYNIFIHFCENSIINIYRLIFIVLLSMAQSHRWEFTMGPLGKRQSAPDSRIGQAANFWACLYDAICWTFTQRHLYYLSTMRLILILPSLRGCKNHSKCAAHAQSRISQWFSWKTLKLTAAWVQSRDLSRPTGKHATTTPQRPNVR